MVPSGKMCIRDRCIAYKPNLAFYESMGVKGWIAFEKTVKYIKDNYPDQFIIADAKRGDIGNTSAMYALSLIHICFEKGEPQKQLSKEFVREWLMENGFQGKEGQKVPEMTPAIVQSISCLLYTSQHYE